MSQPHLSGLQESINKLAQGSHNVLLDTSTGHLLPAAMMLLLETARFKEFDKLLAQISTATRAVDKNLRLTASTCYIETAKSLAVTKYKNWERLEQMIPGLKTIAGSPVYLEQDRSSAKSILDQLESMQLESVKTCPAEQSAAQDPLTRSEERIFQLANAGDIEMAKEQLCDLVVTCARKKDFANAERLCERIYDIDSMALMEIIQCSELIEQEKSGTLCEDKLKTWSKLRETLTDNEFNNLYHLLEGRAYKPEERIVAQGTLSDELYFIACGSVRVSYMVEEKEFFLRNLDSGDIAGENFFHASVWTVSLTAMQPTSILILRRDKLSDLERKNPGIESKLRDYYRRVSDIHKMLRLKGMDRRVHERYKLDCPIQLQVYDERDNILSSFKAETEDISKWGLCFIIRITRRENSRLLLGRKIQINMPVRITRDTILLRGTVIGVQPFDLVASDFSIHVKFAQELDRRTIQAILGEYHAYIR